MQFKPFFAAICAILCASNTWAATEIRLATHDSFDLPKDTLAKFEQLHNAKISIIKAGDGNELLNKLIISKRKPIADVVYGLDNGNILKAIDEQILAKQQPASAPTVVKLPNALAVDFGFVAINYDKKWFQDKGLPLPKTLEDLTKPEYKNLMVMPNPNTSTPAFAFLLANIGGLGEEPTFQWWQKMRDNGVKITKGWSDAYYKEFSLNGGSRPLMVGYSTSPAAEVFYSEGKLSTPNMGNLFLRGGVYRQIEGAAVLQGTAQPELANRLTQYLQNPEVQRAVPANMWVYPALKGAHLPSVMRHASVPSVHFSPNDKRVHDNRKAWLQRWSKTVLR